MEKDVSEEFQDVYKMIIDLNKQNMTLTKLIKDHIKESEKVDVYQRR